MFRFNELAPGQWRWTFIFREQILAQADAPLASRGKAIAAAEVFAREVGIALHKMLGH